MKINIYYGGRWIVDDPTLFALEKIENVLSELNVEPVRYNLYDYKIVSLNSLGLFEEDIDFDNLSKKGRDGLGHEIEVGDIVLYLHRQENFSEIYPKTVELFVEENYYRDSTLTKYHNEIIDLSKVHLGNLILKENRDMMIIDL